MGKIHDPNLDGLFRNGIPQPQAAALALAPMNPDQVLAFIASEQLAAGKAADAQAAVEIACQVFAEAIAAFKTNKLHRIATEVQARLEVSPTQ